MANADQRDAEKRIIGPRARWGRLLPVDGAAEYLGISRTRLAALAISTKRIGRRKLYDIHDLDRFADRLAEQTETNVQIVSVADTAAAAAAEEKAFFERRNKRRGRKPVIQNGG